MTADVPQNLTPAEAAHILKIGLSNCLRQLAAGEIPGIKLGTGRWTIPHERFTRWQNGEINADGTERRPTPAPLTAFPQPSPDDRQLAVQWARGAAAYFAEQVQLLEAAEPDAHDAAASAA